MTIIKDEMTRGAHAFLPQDFVGRTIQSVHEIADSDRGEWLLLLDNGVVVLLSCDPGYAEDLVSRTDDKWDVVLYDATETEAGRAVVG